MVYKHGKQDPTWQKPVLMRACVHAYARGCACRLTLICFQHFVFSNIYELGAQGFFDEAGLLKYFVLYTLLVTLTLCRPAVLPLPMRSDTEFHGADALPTELPGPVPLLMRYMNNILLIR